MYDIEGQTLGNYRLIRLLGHGGAAKVYLGEHIHLNTQAAVKVLQDCVTEELQVGFLTEAQIIASLEHPHIVRILDFGVERQLSYLVMNYAFNGTLHQRHCEGSRPPLSTIETYFKQIASALQFAHEHHVIHRDVKPQNMLIGLEDEILLSDFGLAIVSQSRSFQHMQNRAGTLLYMAPEQFEGKAYPASDQYALGVVVYEWLCGEPPFQGTYHEIAMQHQFAPPPPLYEKDSTIPTELEQVVLKALAKDPRARFACVQDFAAAFALACHPPSSTKVVSPSSGPRRAIAPPRFLGSSPVLRARTAPDRQKRLSTSMRLLLGLMVLIAIGSLGLFAPALLTYYASVSLTATPQPAALATAAAQAYAAATSKGVMAGFDAQHTNFNPYERVLSPTNVSHLVLAWTFSAVNNVSSLMIIYNNIYVDNNEGIYVLDASTGKPLRIIPIDSSMLAAANGIIYISSSKFYALDASTGKPRWTAAIGGIYRSDPTVADGVVYVSSSDNKLYAFDASTGKPRWTSVVGKVAAFEASDPIVAGGVVYVSSSDNKLYAFDASTGKPRWTAAIGDEGVQDYLQYYYYLLTVADDIVYADRVDGSLHAFSISTGKQLWVTSVNDDDSTGATIANGVAYVGTQDGKLYASVASTGKLLWTIALGNAMTFSPVVANGVIYIGLQFGKLYALAASTGKILWSASVGGVASPPVVANGMVYVGSYDDHLYAFHLAGSPA